MEALFEIKDAIVWVWMGAPKIVFFEAVGVGVANHVPLDEMLATELAVFTVHAAEKIDYFVVVDDKKADGDGSFVGEFGDDGGSHIVECVVHFVEEFLVTRIVALVFAGIFE